MYAVKEIFRTLQGEGGQTGRVAIFCRFAGCNLWSGREKDRAKAICNFCDTQFIGGEKYATASDLAAAIDDPCKFVVLTGGEPLLQIDDALIIELHARGLEIALETNGTIKAPSARIDWICVSPKTADIVQTGSDELKLVYPQAALEPGMFEHMAFGRFSLSPMDGPDLDANRRAAIDYCMAHPQWRLTLQTHKLLGIR